MANPAFHNRWNLWQRRQVCGACDCEGVCMLKAQGGGGIGGVTWCVESTSCDPKCNCYCITRTADGFFVNNCPSFAAEGEMRSGVCLKCPPNFGFLSRHNKCEGGPICGGACLFRSNGGAYEQLSAGCKPNNTACNCPPPPSYDDAPVGEIRWVGPCTSAGGGEEEE